jgi:hypothetical protein
MARFPAPYCITGCGTILARKKNTQKNTRQSMNMKTKIHLKKTRLSLQLVPAATILIALAMSMAVVCANHYHL